MLCASGAAEARTLLEREFVDVIVADRRMPGTSAVDFLKHARESWSDVARIIISAYADTDDINAGIKEAGTYQYILNACCIRSGPKSTILPLLRSSGGDR